MCVGRLTGQDYSVGDQKQTVHVRFQFFQAQPSVRHVTRLAVVRNDCGHFAMRIRNQNEKVPIQSAK